MKNRFEKKYQLWINNGDGGYTPYQYDTLYEVFDHEKWTSDWYITKSVNVEFNVTEINDVTKNDE